MEITLMPFGPLLAALDEIHDPRRPQGQRDRSTIAKYVRCGLEPPSYGPRKPRPTVLSGPVTPVIPRALDQFRSLAESLTFSIGRVAGLVGNWRAA
jgi:hypothetical protein